MKNLPTFHDARGIAAPVLAARTLLDRPGPRERVVRGRLKRGKGELPLPSQCPERTRLEAALGHALPAVDESPGVFCLSAHELAAGRFGSIQRLRVIHVRAGGNQSFADGCEAGRLAAAQWLIDRYGAVELPQTAGFSVEPLHPALPTVVGRGPSAGLAAVLAYAYHLLGGPQDLPLPRMAATGRVAPDGKVLHVDDVREKLEAVLREAPFVDVVFVPRADEADVPPAMKQRVVAVDHVRDALDHVFGHLDQSYLAMMDPLEAAERAAQHDIDKEHALARALADRILESPILAELPLVDELQASWTARSIRAIHLSHEGKAREARDELAELKRDIQRAPEDILESVVDSAFSALLAARASSVHIDLLDLDEAVALCEELGRRKGLDSLGKVALYGSWCRALACRGDLDEAKARSEAQRRPHLGRKNIQQDPQRRCNHIDILLRSHERGCGEDLDRAETALARAREVNDGLGPCQAQQANAAYLDFWDLRIAARYPDLDRVMGILGDRSPDAMGRPHPDHLMHRHVGEAFARSGELERALDWLDRAVAVVPEDFPAFLRLALLTTGAYASLLRIEHGRGEDEWFPHADAFFSALESWCPGFAQRPAAGQPAGVWKDRLQDALRRFPY